MTFYPGITALGNKISVDIPKVEANFAHLKAVLSNQFPEWSDVTTTFSKSGLAYRPDSTEKDQGAEGLGKSLKAYMDDVGVTKNATIRFIHTGIADTTTYQFKTSEVIQDNFLLEIEKGALLDTDYSICDVGVAWTWANHAGAVYKLNETISEPETLTDNGVELTKVAAIVNIDAAGKWCWSGNTVYVRTTSSVDPDTLASGILQAGVKLTIECPHRIADHQVFSGYGKIVFGPVSGQRVKAVWWDDDVKAAALSVAHVPTWGVTSNCGGIVELVDKTYDVTASIILHPGVILEGINPAATCLKAKTALNAPVVTSYNFSTLTTSGDTLASEDVPYLFGLRNLRINGNKTNQAGNNNGVSFYGKGFIVDQVIIHDCSGHGWYSECGQNVSIATWQDETLSWVGGLVTRDNTLTGFYLKGIHDIYIQKLESHANGAYGIYNTRLTSPGEVDGTLTFSHIHTYGNTSGNYFGHEVFGMQLTSEDNILFTVAADSGTNYEPHIASLFVSSSTAGVACDIDRPNMSIGKLHVETLDDGITGLKVQEDHVYIGACMIEGNQKNGTGVLIVADNVKIGQGRVYQVQGTGAIGLQLGDTAVPIKSCDIALDIWECENGLHYVDNSGFGNRLKSNIWTLTGKNPLHTSCLAPNSGATLHDDFDIISTLQGTPDTYKRTRCFTSEAFSLNAGAPTVVTVTITHNLLWTPSIDRDLMVCVNQAGGTDAWVISYVKITASDATTVTVKVRVTTAAVGESGKIVLWARN